MAAQARRPSLTARPSPRRRRAPRRRRRTLPRTPSSGRSRRATPTVPRHSTCSTRRRVGGPPSSTLASPLRACRHARVYLTTRRRPRMWRQGSFFKLPASKLLSAAVERCAPAPRSAPPRRRGPNPKGSRCATLPARRRAHVPTRHGERQRAASRGRRLRAHDHGGLGRGGLPAARDERELHAHGGARPRARLKSDERFGFAAVPFCVLVWFLLWRTEATQSNCANETPLSQNRQARAFLPTLGDHQHFRLRPGVFEPQA